MKFKINYSMKLIKLKLKIGKYFFNNKNNKLLYVIFSNIFQKQLIIKVLNIKFILISNHFLFSFWLIIYIPEKFSIYSSSIEKCRLFYATLFSFQNYTLRVMHAGITSLRCSE